MADPAPTPDPTPDPAPDPAPAPTPDPEPDPIGDKPITSDDDWQTKARKHERDLKKERDARKDLADRLKVIEDKDKTDAERLAEKATADAKRADEAEAKLLRAEVAADKGVPTKLAKFLTGSTKEELEQAADEILEELNGLSDDDPPRRPRERLRTGAQPTSDPDKTDPASLAAKVPRGW